MIVLDTNIISELMRREPDGRVMAWIGEQPMAGVFTTTLTQAEIFYGLALLPDGSRRDDLLAAARPMFDVDLVGRVLPFDIEAAHAYPEIAAGRKRPASRSVRSTRRSPRSCARGARGWRPATSATSLIAGSRSSIRGSKHDSRRRTFPGRIQSS